MFVDLGIYNIDYGKGINLLILEKYYLRMIWKCLIVDYRLFVFIVFVYIRKEINFVLGRERFCEWGWKEL